MRSRHWGCLFLPLVVACLEPVEVAGPSTDAGVTPHDAGAARTDGGLGAPDARAVPDASAVPDAGPCGDEQVQGRFAQCQAAKDEQTCVQRGGAWNTGPFGEIFCQCPTGQSGCPCTSNEQCLGDCVAPMTGGQSCESLVQANCAAVGITFGCWCTPMTGPGKFTGICWD